MTRGMVESLWISVSSSYQTLITKQKHIICLILGDNTGQDPWSVEEKSYQDNGGLHRKPYNFFKQEVKREIRIGAPLSGH